MQIFLNSFIHSNHGPLDVLLEIIPVNVCVGLRGDLFIVAAFGADVTKGISLEQRSKQVKALSKRISVL